MDKHLFRSIAGLIALTAVLAVCVIQFNSLAAFGASLLQILNPLFLGIALAFVLNVPTGFVHRLYERMFSRIRVRLPLMTLAIATVYLLFLCLITGLVAFLIPQLVDSVGMLSANIGGYSENVVAFLERLSVQLNLESLDLTSPIQTAIESLPSMLTGVAKGVFPHIFSFTSSIVRTLTSMVLGFLLSIYLLADKDRLKDRLRRMLIVFARPSTSETVLRVGRMTGRTFTSFVNGQLADMLIVGVLCFTVMSVLGLRYAPLISVIIAVTNVIPIAGPVIGAVPSIFILLMADPIQALWFGILLVVLQQIDGNLIYPRVVGESIGLPPLFVLLAVLIGGGLFGIIGMLLGVPAVSVIYQLLREETSLRWNARAKSPKAAK